MGAVGESARNKWLTLIPKWSDLCGSLVKMEIPIHNLLVHRFGITAEQLDGFLDTLGISYDKNRINGKKLLEWEAKSNLDVRGIVAIALNESSLGTAGVATNPGANMFGFGAYDSNPEYASNF